MHIGIDARCLLANTRTGVGEYAYELLNALFKIDKKNEYYLFCNSATKKLETGNCPALSGIPLRREKFWGNVHLVCTKYPNKLFNLSLQLFRRPRLDDLIIRQLGQASNVDLWFSPNLNFTALSSRVKHILTIHDLSFEHFPDCYSRKRRLWHRALNPRRQCERADLILTPSEHTRRDVIETYSISEEKVRCIYPGLSEKFMTHDTDNMTQVRQKYILPGKFILFLGTIEPRKNIPGLIEAYRILCSLLPAPCSLIIAGPFGWKYEPIMKAIEETEGVQYIGYVAPEDKPALYQLADLFVYPSLYEGFGFPVLEAMAAGTPVITSNRSSLPEVTGDAAYLVNPYNVSELARAMEMLTTDARLRALLIERGKRRAGEFRWEETARNFIETCKHVNM